MDKDKSILEKFTDTVKEMANSASEALKADEPPTVEQSNAGYMPYAAEGLATDPLQVPPLAARPRKPAAKGRSRPKTAAKRATPKKQPRKAAKTSARSKSKARSAAKASARRTTKPATKGKRTKRPAKRNRR